jgi:hypothetical protein
MKSLYSDACTHNQHPLCRDQNCQCGCHYIEKKGGLTPEEFKHKMGAIAAMEESI